MKTNEYTVRVWDPAVRLGHWTLVTAFFTAYFTEDDFLSPHVWAGYVVGAIVVFRVVWGFVGSSNARFANFVRPPRVTFDYLVSLMRRNAPRDLGHNPAGAAMIVALLLSLSGTVFSGLVLYALEENAGPLAGIADSALVAPGEISLVSTASADDEVTETEHKDDREEFWEESHEILSNITLFLVIIHVLGVLGSSYLHKENLIRAMLTGRKRSSVD